ncbi:unnamed protein product [Ilex paraguariensis]|uniref:Uncharacterized protein n=1 Tax=Ilex paraguariensis TaxID=185542 RepID=A0ABC8U7N3_9AQUA
MLNEKIDSNHLLDFLRNCLVQSHPPKPPNKIGKYQALRCATKPHEAGGTFKKGESENLFDVKFESGVLEIPYFSVNFHTECILQNLIALELCDIDPAISDYITFWDALIDSPEDVDLLNRSGIIYQRGDIKDVCNMFNKLGKEVAIDHEKYYFARIHEQLNGYCKIPWNKWMATLKRDYFGTPWATLSIGIAAILLLLTFIQAVCSIISVT